MNVVNSPTDEDFFTFMLQVIADHPNVDLIYNIDMKGDYISFDKMDWVRSIGEESDYHSLYAMYHEELDMNIIFEPKTGLTGYLPRNRGFEV